MPWVTAEEINSWEDICEKVLGLKYNNRTEITKYPLPGGTRNLVNKNNSFTLFYYDDGTCTAKPTGVPNTGDSYSVLLSWLYIILMEYAEEDFDQENYNKFLKDVGDVFSLLVTALSKICTDKKFANDLRKGVRAVHKALSNRADLPFPTPVVSTTEQQDSKSDESLALDDPTPSEGELASPGKKQKKVRGIPKSIMPKTRPVSTTEQQDSESDESFVSGSPSLSRRGISKSIMPKTRSVSTTEQQDSESDESLVLDDPPVSLPVRLYFFYGSESQEGDPIQVFDLFKNCGDRPLGPLLIYRAHQDRRFKIWWKDLVGLDFIVMKHRDLLTVKVWWASDTPKTNLAEMTASDAYDLLPKGSEKNGEPPKLFARIRYTPPKMSGWGNSRKKKLASPQLVYVYYRYGDDDLHYSMYPILIDVANSEGTFGELLQKPLDSVDTLFKYKFANFGEWYIKVSGGKTKFEEGTLSVAHVVDGDVPDGRVAFDLKDLDVSEVWEHLRERTSGHRTVKAWIKYSERAQADISIDTDSDDGDDEYSTMRLELISPDLNKSLGFIECPIKDSDAPFQPFVDGARSCMYELNFRSAVAECEGYEDWLDNWFLKHYLSAAEAEAWLSHIHFTTDAAKFVLVDEKGKELPLKPIKELWDKRIQDKTGKMYFRCHVIPVFSEDNDDTFSIEEEESDEG